MTQEEIIAGAAAVLTTIHETGGAPESSCYLALGSNLALWDAIKSLLLRAGWAKSAGHWMTLTPDGTKKARALAALLTK